MGSRRRARAAVPRWSRPAASCVRRRGRPPRARAARPAPRWDLGSEQRGDRLRLQAACHEPERLGRRARIEPVRVVDHTQQRPALAVTGEQAEHRHTDQEWPRGLAALSPNAALERLPLGLREALQRSSSGGRAPEAPRTRGSSGTRRSPQRRGSRKQTSPRDPGARFADPRLAVQRQHAAAPRARGRQQIPTFRRVRSFGFRNSVSIMALFSARSFGTYPDSSTTVPVEALVHPRTSQNISSISGF